jgi:DNA-binding NtrC family response regulator
MPETNYPAFSAKPIPPSKKVPAVLVVEKEKLLRLMMAKLLQVSGYRVYTCGDSPQALALIKERSFDLVITELMMEGANGIEVLRAIRRSQPRVKVIIVTSTPSSETLLEAKYEGAYAYLSKPLQLKHFLSVLKDAIEHTRLRDGYDYQREIGNAQSGLEDSNVNPNL